MTVYIVVCLPNLSVALLEIFGHNKRYCSSVTVLLIVIVQILIICKCWVLFQFIIVMAEDSDSALLCADRSVITNCGSVKVSE